jgi:hypothetical protein
VTFACTYAAPGPFCSRMFAMWADLAPVLGVPFVMRDVTLWAFTVPFFEQRGAELAEFETAMRYMDQPVHAYLAQLAVIQNHDTTDRLGDISVPALVLAGEEDILIPVSLSRAIHEGIPGSEWATTKGGHACVWEHPAEFNRTFLDFVRRHGKGYSVRRRNDRRQGCAVTAASPQGGEEDLPREPSDFRVTGGCTVSYEFAQSCDSVDHATRVGGRSGCLQGLDALLG